MIALSTSGSSRNVVQSINTAKKLGLTVIGFTGMCDTYMKKTCDITITIPSEDTQRVQEGHILVGHIICEIIENHFK